MSFLAVSMAELQNYAPDFVLVTGDAYVDHPSFGHAIIGRLLEAEGFSVAILAQPVKDVDYKRFGRPNIGFLISPGVVDSMVNNYTVSKKRRNTDEYSEGGKAGKRPDRALTVYSRALKRLYPDSPVIVGGIEASLRRFAHYDYWKDEVMPSVLIDSGADLLIYGMGEKPFWDIVDMLKRGIPLAKIRNVRGTAYVDSFANLSKEIQTVLSEGEEILSINETKSVAFGGKEYLILPSYEDVCRDKVAYARTFHTQMTNTDAINGKPMIQKQTDGLFLFVNSAQYPMTVAEMDKVYDYPYEREVHPMYKEKVPAIEEVKFSVVSHRGCFGSCSFCALNYHQGRVVQKRSIESILREVEILTKKPDFKGNIHDVGGPSANFRNPSCQKQLTHGTCPDKFCIGDKPCKNLVVDHNEYRELLQAVREVPGVKRVFIRSGIRFDYLMYDKDDRFFKDLCQYYVSGQLKVAPEHCAEGVLQVMNKPNFEIYKRFVEKYTQICGSMKREQYIVPYFISSHPGCTLKQAVTLTQYLKSIHYMPLQVQDFYPTPSTRSTCMFYTGLDPFTMKPIFVPRTAEEKSMQRALLQYRKPENRALIEKALYLCNKQELIGGGQDCIIARANYTKINKGIHDEGGMNRSKDRRFEREIQGKERGKQGGRK